ncbi:uncharacterized protein LOC116248131 [Nymphaea colorata]|nr:uncharacterized protein LOC116248131 [Nymphaea colorata]
MSEKGGGTVVNLHCPSSSKPSVLRFVALEGSRLDVGTIARCFGLDPSSVRFNGYYVSRGTDFISSLTWTSLLSFFSARGFPTGKETHDPLVVEGKPSKEAPPFDERSTFVQCESKEIDPPAKRKTWFEDLANVDLLKKRRTKDRDPELTNPRVGLTTFPSSTGRSLGCAVAGNVKRLREEDMVLAAAYKRIR